MTDIETPNGFDALNKVMDALKGLSPEDQKRIIETASVFFKIHSSPTFVHVPEKVESHHIAAQPHKFSGSQSLSPKEFLLEKEPKTDVERMACLAFYLTHYRDTPHFKTLDLSILNTEAAQPKFANASTTVDNATKMGYLAPAIKGHKQLSAFAEKFVQALPDRDAAKDAMSSFRPRNKKKAKSSSIKNNHLPSDSNAK